MLIKILRITFVVLIILAGIYLTTCLLAWLSYTVFDNFNIFQGIQSEDYVINAYIILLMFCLVFFGALFAWIKMGEKFLNKLNKTTTIEVKDE